MEQIRIGDLTRLQAEELRHMLLGSAVDPKQVSVEAEPSALEGSRHGLEPMTMIALALGPQALSILAAWTIKTRARRVKTFKMFLKKPDGTEVSLDIKDTGSTEEAARAEIMRAVQAAGGSVAQDTGTAA